MGEDSNDPASKDLLLPDIPTLVQRCLKVEQDRDRGRDRGRCQFKQHILLNPSVTYAKILQKELPELLLLTFDNRLQKAAQGEGLPRQP